MLEELGIDYEREQVDIRSADRYSAGALAPTCDDAQRGKYLYWMMYTLPGAAGLRRGAREIQRLVFCVP